jgi:hypothetical protein
MVIAIAVPKARPRGKRKPPLAPLLTAEGGDANAARRRLNAVFIRKVLAHFDIHGDEIIDKVARETPGIYFKMLAFLQPRDLEVTHRNPMTRLSDEQLANLIHELEQRVTEKLTGTNTRLINGEAVPIKSNAKTLAYARAYYYRRKAERLAAKGQLEPDGPDSADSPALASDPSGEGEP